MTERLRYKLMLGLMLGMVGGVSLPAIVVGIGGKFRPEVALLGGIVGGIVASAIVDRDEEQENQEKGESDV